MNPFFSIAGAGGFGGLLAALITRATGVGMFAGWNPVADICAEIAFGVAAALFGVYMLSASDPKNVKTVVFAIACGLTWHPLVAGASSYAKQYTSVKTASDASQAAASLTTSAETSSPATVQSAVNATTTAIGKLSDVTDASDRNKIVAASQSVVEKVSASSTVQPSVKIEALRNIGVASLSADSQAVSLQTIQPLKELANSQDPATRSQAESALRDLAAEAAKQNRPLVTAALKAKLPATAGQP